MEKTYIEELLLVVRPTSNNHIFNDVDNDVIETKTEDGVRMVILREKEVKN